MTKDATEKDNGAAAGFSDTEKTAMRDRSKELKADARMSKNRAAGEAAVLEAIDAMPEPDRTMATRLHTIVIATAPELMPKTWYGMPAYAKDGKVVCFFQGSQKFKTRYSTFGFNDIAKLDEGNMWPTSYALIELGVAEEARIVELVKRALG